MDSRPRLHGGRLSAGKTDGGRGSVRGTRFRGNDRWGGGSRITFTGGREVGMDSRPRLHGGRLSAGKTDGGRGSVRGTRFRGMIGGGAVPESPFQSGREVGMDSRPRLHGGRLSAGKTDGGEGIREGDEIPGNDRGVEGTGEGGSRIAPTDGSASTVCRTVYFHRNYRWGWGVWVGSRRAPTRDAPPSSRGHYAGSDRGGLASRGSVFRDEGVRRSHARLLLWGLCGGGGRRRGRRLLGCR